jgi:preprotein translocase subunit SecF
MRIFVNTHYDFLKWRWHAIAMSWIIILAGVGLMVKRGGPPLGIDFSGGTIVVAEFEKETHESVVRSALDAVPGEKVVQTYGDPAQHRILIRLPQAKGAAEQGFALESGANQVKDALTKANVGKFNIVSQEFVGPVVGEELRQKGFWATALSIIGIGIYVWYRFRFSFAVGASVATVHDLLITISFLVFFNYEFSLNIIAALLTIAGYSVNDTIVVFDRVRENLHLTRREPLAKVINESVNQTLGRTVITSSTTFLAVLSLFLFGGEVLRGFAFTMLVGIVTGTYSTVFIASSVAVLIGEREAATAARTPAKSTVSAGTGATAGKPGAGTASGASKPAAGTASGGSKPAASASKPAARKRA